MGQQVPFVDLARQHGPLTGEIEEAIGAVLERGDFILGEAVGEFERRFADYVGVRNAVGVGSGTAALSTALRAGGVGPGDQVIVPAHTYIASALAVLHAGAEPVFCDVDADTGLLDPTAAAAAVGPRTAAIIVVHLYGQVAATGALAELAGRRGLMLLEDSAQAHGARLEGRMAGTLGDAAAFSFYPSKNLGALGDGGMICTNDAELAAAARRWRNLGQAEKGVHAVPGLNERLDTLQAAVLLRKLLHLDEWNRSRRRAAGWYRQRLGVEEAVAGLLPERPGAEDVFHLFPVRIGGGVSERDRVRAELGAAGIGTGIHYWPAVHRQPPFERAGGPAGAELPLVEAEAWAEQELSLPIFPGITEGEVEAVCAALERAVGSVRPAGTGG